MSILDPSSGAFFPIFGDFGFIKELKVRKLSPKSVQLADSLTGVWMKTEN